MKQDVLVKISGLHMMVMNDPSAGEEDNEPIEVITPANYYWKNGKHYIIYDEVVEGLSGGIKNKIKITGNSSVEIMKSGITNSHMVFEKDKMNLNFYETPYGKMQVGTHTHRLEVNVQDDLIDVKIEYGLYVEQQAMADCKIKMQIRPKKDAGIVFGQD